MVIAVTGSIATDHLMTFSGRFAEQFVADQLERVSLSFLVDDLDIRRGGVAANICFGLASLGRRSVLVGAVGVDFAEYRSWLDRAGVDTQSVHVSELKHSARFVCTTDADQNQLASFYPGAMGEARNIELGPIAERVGGLDLVLISPNDPEAMLRHTRECRERGLPFAADPSQQLAWLDGEAIRELVNGAAFLFTNEYERALIEQKSAWSSDELLDRVDVRVTTLGAAGALIERRGEPDIRVPVCREERKADPTGVGDAFRAGFLAGLSAALPLERSAQLGSLLATYAIETVGTQEYSFTAEEFVGRFAGEFGPDAADEIRSHVRDTAA